MQPKNGHHRNVLRCWIGSAVAFLVVAPLISVIIGLHLHTRDFQYVPDKNIVPFNGRTLQLEVVLISTNPSEGSMTMDWTITGEAKSPCNSGNLDACTDVNIFFDKYSSEILVFAQDATSNNTVGIDVATTRGIAVGFKTHAVDRSDVITPTGMLDILVILQRGNLVKAFSIVIVVAIWMITLILLLVMFTCVFFGFRQRSEVLVVPVATLFAFTQLRGSMPGAPPGFGDILDFVGLLPCLALLSLLASITLGAFILSDPTAKAKALDWDLFFEAFPRLKSQRALKNAPTEEGIEIP